MLFEIMRNIKNFFPTEIHKEGRFTIEDGTISLPFMKEGQFFIIEGSDFNDCEVYQYPCNEMIDETFTGRITVLAPPKSFLDLVEKIEAFCAEDKRNAFQSESFGGYSYTRASNGKGGLADWQDVFKERLNVWRKI